MAKVIICFIMTILFSFLSVHSFMSNDYGPLKQWMLYYQEYKALQGALDKGNAGKAELLAKLKAMYPERAQEIEEKKSSLSDTLQDVTSSARSEASAARKSAPRQETTTRSSSTTSNTSRSTTRTTDNRRDTQSQSNR